MRYQLAAILLLPAVLLGAPSLALGQLGIKPPRIDLPRPPRIDLPKPPRIDVPKPPDLPRLDPTRQARRELENARRSAQKGLRRLSPQDVFGNVERSLTALAGRAGVKVNRASGEVDLRGTAAGRTLNSWLNRFAQGNARKAEVEELSYNTRTRILQARLYVRHHQRQNWGVLGRIDLYDCTQRARFRYDFRRGEAAFDIDLGPLAPRINERVVKALREGDLVKAAEAAGPSVVGDKVIRFERRNDYDRVLRDYERKYGRGNVYLSSRRFVEWAGSRSIGKYAATGVISGGSAVWPQIMKDAQEMAAKELPDLVAWLERQGQGEARAMARQLLTGRKPAWPFLKFEMVVVPHYAREVDRFTGKVKTPWRRFNNLGFVVVFQPR